MPSFDEVTCRDDALGKFGQISNPQKRACTSEQTGERTGEDICKCTINRSSCLPAIEV